MQAVKKRRKLNILIVSAVLMLCMAMVFFREELELTATEIRQETVWINEVCNHNFSAVCNENGQYYDYIELYNPTQVAVSLKGWSLSDSAEKLDKFVFEEQVLSPGEYLLVFAAGRDAADAHIGHTQELYAPFKISKRGETLFLSDEQGDIVDVVAIPADLKYNTSYSRSTDEVRSWEVTEASPLCGNETAAAVIPETLAAPSFSVESGFYEAPFYLELGGIEDGMIFYTLDGSEPTPQTAICYTEPIPVTDASMNENVYSMRTDLSAGFFMEDDRYAVPEERVDKAVIVRAAAFDASGTQKSQTVTKTYFIGFGQKDYADFEIVSLVTDPVNLFDYETGIYVAGKTFDEFVASGEREQMRDPAKWRQWKANYMNRGRTWERPVHVDYFGENRSLIFSQELGLRIKGGTTRSYTQKSFNLFARDMYGEAEFQVPFFDEKGKTRVTLYTVANDYRSKLRDPLMMDLCSERVFATMETRPCYVFLDGEYWGMYYLMEKYGDDYLEENYGVAAGTAVIAKDNRTEGEDPADEVYLEELKQYISEHEFLTEEEYQELNTIIDMRSYLDYYATEIYIERSGDWPIYNEACWRSKEQGDALYHDGRWRWMLYDVNWSCLSANQVEEDTIAYVKAESKMFDKLSQNKSFQRDFTITVCDLMNSVFKVENVAPKLTKLIGQTKASVLRDLKKYYGSNITIEDYEKEVDDLSRFFIERPPYMLQYLKEEFGLSGTVENISIGCSEGGSIQLNTLTIPAETECFTGQYFTDYPIELTAVPEEGYYFVGWNGDVTGEAASMEVKLKEGGMVLQALFAKK